MIEETKEQAARSFELAMSRKDSGYELSHALSAMEKRNQSRLLKGDVYLCGVNYLTNQKIEHNYQEVKLFSHKSEEHYIGED
jgi:hypothetical protein